MKKSAFVKTFCVMLSIILAVAAIPVAVSANSAEVRFDVISDIHYFGNKLKGEEGNQAWIDYIESSTRQFDLQDALLDAALSSFVLKDAKDKPDYLLIPGDLTKDGELQSHVELAEKLEAFEKESGIEIFVINGNHDINNSKAVTFENGVEEPATKTTPEDFRRIYANLGYDHATAHFVPAEGNKGGMLSYAVELDGYYIIAIDSCQYSEDNGAEGDEHLTDGKIGDDLLNWVVDQANYAKEKGLTVVGLQHHNLIPHMEIEEATIWAFVVEDWQRIAEAYADAGVHYIFTGHFHSQDIVSHTSDNGETVSDIMTASLTGFPNLFRTVDFKTDSQGKVTADIRSFDVDTDKQIVCGDRVFEKPFKYSYSFFKTYSETGARGFAFNAVMGLIDDYLPQIQAAGGLYNFLVANGIDLEQIIIDALGTNGLEIGPIEILTVRQNLGSFIRELCGQVDELFVNDIASTKAFVEEILSKLIDFEVSELPATSLIEPLGLGDPNKPGTLGDAANIVMYTAFSGDEDISDDEFMLDVLDGFENGDTAERFFNVLFDVVVNDLAQEKILSGLDLNLGALFPKGAPLFITGQILNATLSVIFGGDTSLLNIVNSVLAIPLVPDEYSSVNAIIDHLKEEYITQSQYEAWGHTIAWMVSTMLFDENPEQGKDCNAKIVYDGPVEVIPTVADLRLPAHVVTTLGEDSTTSWNVTWYTKHGVNGTDIQIIPYSENPDFENAERIDTITVSASTEQCRREYPGADLGILALLNYPKEYVHHNITLTNLTPGTKYSYRIGDASFGWWSEAGVIETAAGESGFNFVFLSDMQAQNEKQYKTFVNVVNTAMNKYPETKFIVSAGDNVDYGENFKLWGYLFDGLQDVFLDVAFMPTTGNHEDEGAVFDQAFNIPYAANRQDSGIYYSYDYNDVHFIHLNTNDIVDDKLSEEQLEWLKADAKASDADWKIVVLHKALYSNGSHYDDGDVVGMRAQLSALLPYLGIDLVLQGHDHVYLRTDVMNANLVSATKTQTVTHNGQDYECKMLPDGTIYTIPACAGVKLYKTKDTAATDELFPRAESIVDVENPVFTAITVDGNRLYYDAYTVTGENETERIDSFAIEKDLDAAPAYDTVFSGIAEFIFTNVDFTVIWEIFVKVFPFYSEICDMM